MISDIEILFNIEKWDKKFLKKINMFDEVWIAGKTRSLIFITII